VAFTENQLASFGVEVREVFGVLPSEVVVVTRESDLDLEAVDESFGVDFPPRARLSWGQYKTGDAQSAQQCPA